MLFAEHFKVDVQERLEAIFAKARTAHDSADYKSVRRLGSELFELANQHNDQLGMARGHNLLGNAFLHATADGESAERYYRSALEHYRTAGDRRGEAIVMLNLGSLALDINLDLATARSRYEACLPIFEECGDDLNVAMALSNLAEIARLEGDYEAAFKLGMQSLTTFRELKDSTRIGWQLVNIAHYHLLKAEYKDSAGTLRRAYLYLVKTPNPDRLADYLEMWFYLAVETQHFEAAAELLGFLERYRLENDVPRLALLRPWFTPRYERLEARFAYDEFLTLRNKGEGLTLAQADVLTHAIVS